MQVFEIHYPGTWLRDTPDSHQLQILFLQLEGHLTGASVGLALFEQARAQPRTAPRQSQERQLRAQAIERTLERQLPATLTPQERFSALRDISETADIQARRLEWAAGQPPESYKQRLPIIHAHTVVFALDNIGKTLEVLARIDGLPSGVATAQDGYRTDLPDLVKVRDSAHHTEDRARGLDRKGRPLVLQPVDNGVVSAPNGFVGLSNLFNNRLGYTASDGHYCEVEVSAQSVAAGQTAIQRVLDAFSWRGPARTAPL